MTLWSASALKRKPACRSNHLQEMEGGAHAALSGLRQAEEGPGERAGPTALPAAPGAAMGRFVVSHLSSKGALGKMWSIRLLCKKATPSGFTLLCRDGVRPFQRLTRSQPGEQRDTVLQAYISNDLLELHDGAKQVGTHVRDELFLSVELSKRIYFVFQPHLGHCVCITRKLQPKLKKKCLYDRRAIVLELHSDFWSGSEW